MPTFASSKGTNNVLDGDANLVINFKMRVMKRRVLFVENFAKVEKVISQNLSEHFEIDERASRILKLMEGEVSDDLLMMLGGELQGFCGQMQIEMAEDLFDFALAHVVHTTGCASVDYVLDYCYSYIAMEHGIFMELEN